MNRRAVAGLLALAMAGSGGAGWLASSSIRSPAETAARTAPPEPSPILVPAEKRDLAAEVVTRGAARFGAPQRLSLMPSALKPAGGVVASTAGVGEERGEGDVLMLQSGRPVFVLEGDLPSFRDLGPGLEGDDVTQLQEALSRMGFPVTASGAYDARTEAAVTAWYRAAGFEPFTATDDQLADIRGREAEVAAARLDVLTGADGVAQAEADIVAAQVALDRARARAARGPADLAAARAAAEATATAAQADIQAKQAALDELQAAPDPPSSAELATAQAELAQARAAAAIAAWEAAQRVADAEDAAGSAAADVLAIAASLHAAQAISDNAVAALGLRRQLVAAGADALETARRRAGVQVPADEVVVVRQAPIRVSEVTAAPGDPASGPVMVVTNALVAVDGSLPIEDARLVQPGMTVQIDEPDLGISATGSVTQVAASPGTNGVDGFHVYFEVAVDGNPPNLAGVSVRLTIAIDSSGEPTLVVPVSAVSLDPDGSSRVFVDRNGTLEPVVVEPGLAADGFVAVTPVGASLEPGDLVQAGVEPVG